MHCCIPTPTTDSITSTGMIWVTLNMPSAAEECRELSGNFTSSGEWLACLWSSVHKCCKLCRFWACSLYHQFMFVTGFGSVHVLFSRSEFRAQRTRCCLMYGVWVCRWLSSVLVDILFLHHRHTNYNRSLDLMRYRNTWRQPRLDGRCEEVSVWHSHGPL